MLGEKDQRLRPVTELIRELTLRIELAEWDLDFDKADRLYEELGYYRKLVKDGELYVPNF